MRRERNFWSGFAQILFAMIMLAITMWTDNSLAVIGTSFGYGLGFFSGYMYMRDK